LITVQFKCPSLTAERRGGGEKPVLRGVCVERQSMGRQLCLLIALISAGCSGQIGQPNEKEPALAERKGGGAGSLLAVPHEQSTPLSCASHPTMAYRLATPKRIALLEPDAYYNTLRALTGVDFRGRVVLSHPAKTLGFESGVTAFVSEQAGEQYLALAEVAAQSLVEKMGGLLPCDTEAVDKQCVDQFLREVGRRVFRRPMSDAQLADYSALYDEYAGSGPAEAVRAVVEAMLQSPYFLYRQELGSDPDGLMAPYEVAEYLAFAIWKEAPDDALLDLAERGEISASEPQKLARVVESMLADPRAEALFTDYFLQYTGALETRTVDVARYPKFNEGLEAAMAEETRLFVRNLFHRQQLTLDALFTSAVSFVNGPLGALYGLDQANDDAFVEVDLTTHGRAGLLSQASWLSVHSNPALPSPVKRGLFVRERLLCQEIPDPPPDVNDSFQEHGTEPKSERELFDRHFEQPSCHSCHQLIDPIGFAFSQFDAIGALREVDSYGAAVDASGEVVGLATGNIKVGNHLELGRVLAHSEQVEACMGKTLIEYLTASLTDIVCEEAVRSQGFMQNGDISRFVVQLLQQQEIYRRHEVDHGD
jgi:hypothetical protein